MKHAGNLVVAYVNCIEDVFHTHTAVVVSSVSSVSCHVMSCHVMSCDSCLVSPISNALVWFASTEGGRQSTSKPCNSCLPTVASHVGGRIISANWYTQAPPNHWRGKEEEVVLKLLLHLIDII